MAGLEILVEGCPWVTPARCVRACCQEWSSCPGPPSRSESCSPALHRGSSQPSPRARPRPRQRPVHRVVGLPRRPTSRRYRRRGHRRPLRVQSRRPSVTRAAPRSAPRPLATRYAAAGRRVCPDPCAIPPCAQCLAVAAGCTRPLPTPHFPAVPACHQVRRCPGTTTPPARLCAAIMCVSPGPDSGLASAPTWYPPVTGPDSQLA